MTPEEKSLSLLEHLKIGKGVYEGFITNFRSQYLIAGKTIKDWEKQFKIHIPEDASPANCKQLDVQLMQLHQEATFNRASARAALQALKRGADNELNSTKAAMVAQYETSNNKLPAATTLDSLAKDKVKDVDGALMAATVASNFWEDILEHLAFCRKLLENISINNGIEAKATRN